MSYVGPPFTHDIFVTYSHGGLDGIVPSPLKRWSDGFIRELESELRSDAKFARDLVLFFDDHHRPQQGLDPMAGLTEQLRTDIGGAALLQVLMSDQYLASAWCADEREWWLKQQNELSVSLDGRVAVARIWPTRQDWPAAFVDERGHPLVGFCFFDEKRAELRPQPYEWPSPDPTSKGPFRDQLLELVGWLWHKLDLLKGRLEERRRAQQDAARLGEGAGQVLYLHGRVEHASIWRKANEALSTQGFTVLPGEPDPVDGDPTEAQRIRRRRIETLSACDALLLLGTADGRAVDADLVVVGRQDRQAARAFSKRFLPCGLLDTAGPTVATAERLKAARGLQVDWIDSTREPWTTDVQQWLTRKGEAAERSI